MRHLFATFLLLVSMFFIFTKASPTKVTLTLDQRVQRFFDDMDTDKDGFITAQEVLATLPSGMTMEVAKKILAEVDTNKDGKWEHSEIKASLQ